MRFQRLIAVLLIYILVFLPSFSLKVSQVVVSVPASDYHFRIRPLQLNFLFLGPDRPIKFVNEMFLFTFKDHMFDHVSLWCRLSISALHGASLVITIRVVKADYGWTFGHLDVLTIANSLLSNDVLP